MFFLFLSQSTVICVFMLNGLVRKVRLGITQDMVVANDVLGTRANDVVAYVVFVTFYNQDWPKGLSPIISAWGNLFFAGNNIHKDQRLREQVLSTLLQSIGVRSIRMSSRAHWTRRARHLSILALQEGACTWKSLGVVVTRHVKFVKKHKKERVKCQCFEWSWNMTKWWKACTRHARKCTHEIDRTPLAAFALQKLSNSAYGYD